MGQKYITRIAFLRLSGVWLLCALTLSAQAFSDVPNLANHPADENDEKASLELAPYIWAPTISGPVSFGNLSLDLNLEPQELFVDINAGFMAAGQFRSGQNFVIFDGLWLDYRDDEFEPLFDQNVEVNMEYLQIGVGRSFALRSLPIDVDVEPYIGLQHIAINPEISGALGNISVDETWSSPAAGIVLNAGLSERFSASAKLDYAGGFSTGELVSAISVLNYSLNDRATLSLGYRWAQTDLGSDSGFALDLTGGGPVLGLRWMVFP